MFSIIKGLTLSQDELDQYYIQKRKRYYEKHGAIPKVIKLHIFGIVKIFPKTIGKCLLIALSTITRLLTTQNKTLMLSFQLLCGIL